MTAAQQDLEHLRILAIFHYVVAGMVALFACFPLFHLFFGIAMVSGWLDGHNADPAASVMGWFFVAFASVFILAGWTLAACVGIAGRFLQRRKNRTFCLVIAGVQCLFMPFGTVLGIFTILVLVRESVAALFNGVPEPPIAASSVV